MVGIGRFELPTSRLSGVRSNRLSYIPLLPINDSPQQQLGGIMTDMKDVACSETSHVSTR